MTQDVSTALLCLMNRLLITLLVGDIYICVSLDLQTQLIRCISVFVSV